MRRLRLPDLIVPDEWIDLGRDSIQVEIYVRNRRSRRLAVEGLPRTLSSTVQAGSIPEAYAAALPQLIGRLNLEMSGRMAWPEDEPLPPDPAQIALAPRCKGLRQQGHRQWPRKDAGNWEALHDPWDDLVVDD